MTATSYSDAGVDPARADKVLKAIGTSGAGLFGAILSLDDLVGPETRDARLVMGADGVGTKVEVARKMKRYNSIGIDLVAMCVNDILCHGARPVAFLDYYAAGRLHVKRSREILLSIQTGCEIAGCKLVGGETAEMPGTYSRDKFDLAGFCVGVAFGDPFPRLQDIQEEDVIIGIPSSGLHSNGYSLVRKCYDRLGLEYTDLLLTPTRIYVNEVLRVLHMVKSIAHITGGGIHGNLPRALPGHLTYKLSLPHYPWIFQQMRGLAQMKMHDLESTFNCGWGMMMVADPAHERDILGQIKGARTLGVVIPK